MTALPRSGLPVLPWGDVRSYDKRTGLDRFTNSDAQLATYGQLCYDAGLAAAVPAPIVVQPPMDAEAWAELFRLREEVKGPDGFATWKDAAVAERVLRLKSAVAQVLAVQPTPLTDEQIAAINIDVGFTGFNHRFVQFVRAIEIAHGISAPVVPTPKDSDHV